jgi:hypothetical protein
MKQEQKRRRTRTRQADVIACGVPQRPRYNVCIKEGSDVQRAENLGLPLGVKDSGVADPFSASFFHDRAGGRGWETRGTILGKRVRGAGGEPGLPCWFSPSGSSIIGRGQTSTRRGKRPEEERLVEGGPNQLWGVRLDVSREILYFSRGSDDSWGGFWWPNA